MWLLSKIQGTCIGTYCWAKINICILYCYIIQRVSNIWKLKSIEPLKWIARVSPAPKTLKIPPLFKAEKKSAELQIDRIEKELRMSHEQNILLTSKLHKSEREVNSLATKVSAFMVSEIHFSYPVMFKFIFCIKNNIFRCDFKSVWIFFPNFSWKL